MDVCIRRLFDVRRLIRHRDQCTTPLTQRTLNPQSPSISTTSNHRHQTPPRYRHAVHGSPCTCQPPPFDVAPITAKHDVIRKTRSTLYIARLPKEDRATVAGIYTQNFVTIGPSVLEICSRTDRQTHRQTGWLQYCAPLLGWSNNHNNDAKNILFYAWYKYCGLHSKPPWQTLWVPYASSSWLSGSWGCEPPHRSSKRSTNVIAIPLADPERGQQRKRLMIFCFFFRKQTLWQTDRLLSMWWHKNSGPGSASVCVKPSRLSDSQLRFCEN